MTFLTLQCSAMTFLAKGIGYAPVDLRCLPPDLTCPSNAAQPMFSQCTQELKCTTTNELSYQHLSVVLISLHDLDVFLFLEVLSTVLKMFRTFQSLQFLSLSSSLRFWVILFWNFSIIGLSFSQYHHSHLLITGALTTTQKSLSFWAILLHERLPSNWAPETTVLSQAFQISRVSLHTCCFFSARLRTCAVDPDPILGKYSGNS